MNRSIGKLYRKGSSQLPQHFRLRKIFSGKPSKNVPNLPEILKSSNLFFWRITTYPCFPNGEDTAICTRTVTEGSQKKLWEQTTARNIWKSGFSRTKKRIRPEISATASSYTEADYHKDPVAIIYYQTQLRLVVDLQTNVKAMQSDAYARKVKITNLQQMANTLIYIQEHGYDTREDLSAVTSKAKEDLNEARNTLNELTAELKTLNAQIHYTGQYFSSKSIYAEFIKSKKKKVFRREHGSELQAYEQARDWLKNFYPDGKMLSMKTLKPQKQELQDKIIYQENKLKELKKRRTELETVSYNVDAILDRRAMETEKALVHSASHDKSTKERKEESL